VLRIFNTICTNVLVNSHKLQAHFINKIGEQTFIRRCNIVIFIIIWTTY